MPPTEERKDYLLIGHGSGEERRGNEEVSKASLIKTNWTPWGFKQKSFWGEKRKRFQSRLTAIKIGKRKPYYENAT